MTDLLDPIAADGVDEPGPIDWPEHERASKPALFPPDDRTWTLIEKIATIATVTVAVWVTLAQLHPSLIFKNTTPAGGDMGAHVWGPAYLRDHILPHWRLSGWAPDWYAGFPMYQFYMVIPALMVVAVNTILPYGVALKIISVLGILSLPVCCWAFGRLSGMRFPYPPLLALAAVVFLFDESFTIYGGNIASTMAGEYSFSIALSLAILFFGVFAHGLRTGKNSAWAASLAALAALSHGIVLFFVVIGAVALFAVWASRDRLRYVLPVGLVAFLLTAFWLLPFQLRHGFGTDMFYERRPVGDAPNGHKIPDSYWQMFFPQHLLIDRIMFVMMIIGLIGVVVRRSRPGIFIAIMCAIYWAWAWVWPQSLLWNARLLPFMYLCRYLLIAIGVGELIWAAGRLIKPLDRDVARASAVSGLALALVGALLVVGVHLQRLPFGRQHIAKVKGQDTWVYDWGPFRMLASERGFVDGWAKWNYSGYQSKEAFGEYYGIVYAMKRLGQDPDHGCGRALWENNNDQDRYGTPMALMLLPFWTDGCIGSMEGLFFEASGTTPYHFLAASALSKHSSNPVRRLKYEDGQVDKGVDYLKTLGVRYYLAYQPDIVAKAEANRDLTEVAVSGPWHVYQVADTELVTPLKTQPVVAQIDWKNRDRWLELGTSWFQNQSQWGAMPVAEGPKDWQRITLKQVGDKPTDNANLAQVAPATPITPVTLPAVNVSEIKTGDDFMSFTVDKPNVPVLVKMSYFPNWKVSGAQGPYRVAPNLMVVIPTSTHVRLHYGYTGLDLGSYALTAVGLLGLVLLWRRGRVKLEPEESAVFVGSPFAEVADTDLEGRELVGHDLVAHEPVMHEPVAHEPVMYEPVMHEPVMHEPVVHDPVVHDPVMYDPVIGTTNGNGPIALPADALTPTADVPSLESDLPPPPVRPLTVLPPPSPQ